MIKVVDKIIRGTIYGTIMIVYLLIQPLELIMVESWEHNHDGFHDSALVNQCSASCTPNPKQARNKSLDIWSNNPFLKCFKVIP
jgi:hypothetical protein